MRTVTKLTSRDEKVLNHLLKNKKKKAFTLLYYSEWCDRSARIVEVLNEWKLKESDKDEDVYLISSWELPHAFAAFAINSAPSIVKVNRGRVSVMIEYPKVHSYFSAPTPAPSKG
jgi:hypothetical protein